LRQALNEAGKAGDIDALISMYADDVIVMPPNDTTLYGRAELPGMVSRVLPVFPDRRTIRIGTRGGDSW